MTPQKSSPAKGGTGGLFPVPSFFLYIKTEETLIHFFAQINVSAAIGPARQIISSSWIGSQDLQNLSGPKIFYGFLRF